MHTVEFVVCFLAEHFLCMHATAFYCAEKSVCNDYVETQCFPQRGVEGGTPPFSVVNVL